jgi:hypothetical protein
MSKLCLTCNRKFNEKHKICCSCRGWYKGYQNKLYLIKLLGGKCQKCDEKDMNCLQFHHLDDKDFSLGPRMRKSRKYLEKEAKKCILLCANCHQKTHRVHKRIVINYYKSQQKLGPKTKRYYYCVCGKRRGRHSINCQSCASVKTNSKTSRRPPLAQLVSDFGELKSFVQVGKKYGISDNAVRRWCKFYHWFPT